MNRIRLIVTVGADLCVRPFHTNVGVYRADTQIRPYN